MPRPVIVLGAPGTGKTERCLTEVERALADGADPARIAYVSFTRRAVDEARARAAERFNLDPETDLPWFRTLHSLAMHALGAGPDELLGARDFRELSDLLGEDVRGFDSLDEAGEPRSHRPAAMALFLDQLARVRRDELVDVYGRLPIQDQPPWPRVKRAVETYAYYRADTGLLDFTDLLEHALAEGTALNLDLAVVDEAQDLSPLQWDLVWRFLGQARRLVVAGDDDQAIYHWAGADVGRFVDLDGEVVHLPLSHRLPRRVYHLATQVAGRIRHRRQKRWRPRDEDGTITQHRRLEGVPLTDESWLLLARHGSQVRTLAALLEDLALPYETRQGPSVRPDDVTAIRAWEAWRRGERVEHEAAETLRGYLALRTPTPGGPVAAADLGITADRPWYEVIRLPARRVEYYRGIKRRGHSLTARPAVRVSTVHGAKGAQADHVLLWTALNRRTGWAARYRPDDELRVLYVAVTRARHDLHLVADGRRYEYQLGGLQLV